MKRPLAFKDNASGQLAAGISAALTSIPLNTGEGANFPTTYGGSATSAGSSTALNSTGIGASGVAVGNIIENITDGSYAIILSVDTNAIVTSPLVGGSDNTWANSDVWAVNRFVVTLVQYDVDGVTVLKREKVLIRSRSTDTLTVETVPSSGRGYDGSSAQSFDADDYVYQFTVASGFDGVYNVLADIIETATDLAAVVTTKVTNTGAETFAASATGTDAYAITLSPAISALTDGMRLTFRADVGNTDNATLNVNGIGAYDIKKQHDRTLADGDIEAGQLVTVVWDEDNTVWQMQSQTAAIVPTAKFGGDGSDGDVNVASGTTNVDCGGAAVFEVNYNNVTIAVGATLKFINPHANGTVIIMRVAGDCQIAGTLDASDMGAAGGAGGTGGTDSVASTDGSDGSDSPEILDTTAHYGGAGNRGQGSTTPGASKAGSAAYTLTGVGVLYTFETDDLHRRMILLVPGAGGGGGGAGAAGVTANNDGDGADGGAGGRGGGALMLEVAGDLDFTGTIDVSGADGTAGSNGQAGVDGNSAGGGGGGGGGGGAGGYFCGLYSSATATSGTINTAGGTGGNGGQGGAANGTPASSSGGAGAGGGGGGASFKGTSGSGGAGQQNDGAGVGYIGAGGAGGAESSNGTNGGGATDSGSSGRNGGAGGGGGGGGGGEGILAKNKYFA